MGSRLEVKGLHHVTIGVVDLAAAKEFYGGVLGLAEIERPGFGFSGAWYDLGEGRQLHLVVNTAARALRGTTEIDSRDGHFALRVSDFAAALDHLRAHGVEVRDSPTNPTPWMQAYLTDPDGNVIELNVERSGG
jgi:glyoxylase I family protein